MHIYMYYLLIYILFTLLYTHTHTHLNTLKQARKHTYMYMCVLHTHMCVCSCIETYTHMYATICSSDLFFFGLSVVLFVLKTIHCSLLKYSTKWNCLIFGTLFIYECLFCFILESKNKFSVDRALNQKY